MTEVDRLRVVYEVEDARYRASMASMQQLSAKTSQDLVRNADKAESSMRNMRGSIQNFAFQAQDLAVQISAGTAASVALGQQLPQLLGGFGALGAVLGAVVAVGIPLAATFFDMGDGTEQLADATKNAEKALIAYQEAIANTNLSAAELTTRYGEAAGAARELLSVLAQTAEAQALVAQREAVAALQGQFQDLSNMVESYAIRMADGDFFGAQDMAAAIETQFGMTRAEAERLVAVINELNSTSEAGQRNVLLQEMAQILAGAVEEGGAINSEMLEIVDNAVNAGLAVVQIGNAASGASGQVAALTSDMMNLAAQANSAAAALGAAGVFVGSDGSVQRGARGMDPSTAWRFEDPDKDYNTLAERRALEAAQEARRKAAEAKLLAGGGGSGGRKRSGGSKRGGSGREERPFFEDVARDLVQLERQLELIGKTSEEVATMEARWAMMDEAKKRGITVNETMNAQIEAQAAQVGALTAELERAEIAQQQFDQAVEGIADAFAGALVAGESLREGLAQVFKNIASDIIQSGIRNAITSQFGGMNAGGGGGGFNLGSLFGGLFGGFRANGGPVTAGMAYGVGERGPELFVPNVSGAILNQQQIARAAGQGGSTPNITINNNAPGVTVSTDYVTKDEVILTVSQALSADKRKQADARYLRGGK